MVQQRQRTDLGGSSGHLRDGKITSWEGGFRVPAIFWWPGRVRPAVIDGIDVNVALLATVSSIAGAPLPETSGLDSLDLSPTLLSGEPSARTEWFYYGQPGNLWAARVGSHKLDFESWESLGTERQIGWRGYANNRKHDHPLLFDLSTDAGERWDVADREPQTVAAILEAVERHRDFIASGSEP